MAGIGEYRIGAGSMIPITAITQWEKTAPWPDANQVEQDLILSRALVEIFQDERVSSKLVLRGGTALHKVFVDKPFRYSEDIDLVQHTEGPIGPILDGLRDKLDPLLGKPRRERNPGTVTLLYRMQSETPPAVQLKLKVEINSREHFDVFGIIEKRFGVQSDWFKGESVIKTYTIEELLGTKLRALYQRRKGRDLFDLWVGLGMKGTDAGKIAKAFKRYLEFEDAKITGAMFKKNLEAKMESNRFHDDLKPLLVPSLKYDANKASEVITEKLLDIL
jgi:predicted nucleotidyltransferase component of viral defense system